MWGLPQKQNARRADKIRLCGHLRRYKKIVKKTYIILLSFDYTDIQKNTLQCWFSMLWLSVPVLGFLSLLRLRVLFVLFLKLSEPVTHALFFGRSVLFLSRFLSVLNCLLSFCKVLVTIRSTPTNERFSVYFSEHLILQIPIDKIMNIIFYHNHIYNSILFR